MGLVPPVLSLDFGPTFVPKTISDFLKEVSMIGNVKERVSKLEDFVKSLEEEMRKIDPFKRELPLCVILLNDAILTLTEDKMQCIAPNTRPVLEEFIPMKKDCDENEESKKEKDCRDKKNWMSSVQLWNTDACPTNDPKLNPKVETKRNKEENCSVIENSFQTCKNSTGGRPFMPLKELCGFPATHAPRKEDKEELLVHELSLRTPGIKNLEGELGYSGSKTSCSKSVSSSAVNVQSNLHRGHWQSTSRKQRRCWSPELHRRFISALQQLGGSQVATPKQIRELMQVDGLTNDEVKSHLQKYRLHTRRLPTASITPANQSSVVSGGLWVPQDQYADNSKASSSQSGSPQGPLQLAANTGGTYITGGDSLEDDHDEKSESYSCKSHIHKSGKVDV